MVLLAARAKHPPAAQRELDLLVSEVGDEIDVITKVSPVDALKKRRERWSQDIIEVGMELMGSALSAQQAEGMMRAFVAKRKERTIEFRRRSACGNGARFSGLFAVILRCRASSLRPGCTYSTMPPPRTESLGWDFYCRLVPREVRPVPERRRSRDRRGRIAGTMPQPSSAPPRTARCLQRTSATSIPTAATMPS